MSKIEDAERMIDTAGARLYTLEAENERLRISVNRTIELIADLERHGTIDHSIAHELLLRLG